MSSFRTCKYCVWIMVLLAVVSQASLLFASDGSSNNAQVIKDLHAKGVSLYEQQQYGEAAQVYREMLTVAHEYQYYYYVGECEYKRERYDLAIEAFRLFLENTGEDLPAEARAHAEDAEMKSATMVGYLSVKEDNTLEIWVDGEHRGTTPMNRNVAVLPGAHTVSFLQNGESVYTAEVTVALSETVDVQRPEPEPVVEQPAEAPEKEITAEEQTLDTETDATPTKEMSPLTTTGFVMAGFGGAALAASLVTGKLALSKADQLSDNCDGERLCEDSNKNLHGDTDALIKTTNILLATGTVLTVSGVALAIIGRQRSKRSETISLRTTPVVGQNVLGVVFLGSF